MRIDHYGSTATEATTPLQKVNTEQVAKQRSQVQAQKLSTVDTATLSPAAHSVPALVTTALAVSPSRAERVAVLKQAVSTAQYELDAAKTVEALANAYI